MQRSPREVLKSACPGCDVTGQLSGKSKLIDLPGGSQEIRSTGRNLIIVPEVPGKHLEGLFLTTGNVNYALNPDGTEKRLFSGPGRVTDVCALLGP